MSIQNNTNKLQEILEAINALPEANNGVELPTLNNEGTTSDLLLGKQLIDSEGNVVEGNIPNFDGSYECSEDSTGGSSGSGGTQVEAWTGNISSYHIGEEFPVHYTDETLTHRTTVARFMQDTTITIAAGTIIYSDCSNGEGNNVELLDSSGKIILPTANNFEISVG